jgi:hypothetical protein
VSAAVRQQFLWLFLHPVFACCVPAYTVYRAIVDSGRGFADVFVEQCEQVCGLVNSVIVTAPEEVVFWLPADGLDQELALVLDQTLALNWLWDLAISVCLQSS